MLSVALPKLHKDTSALAVSYAGVKLKESSMPHIILGLTMFFALEVSVGSLLLKKLTGGMYSPFFKELPHYVYLSINLFATYIIPLVITLIFVKYCNLKSRLPTPCPSKWLFSVGAFFILFPQILQLWTSTIKGGGVSYILISYAVPFVFVAKGLIIIGAVKIFMAIKPSEKYSYEASLS